MIKSKHFRGFVLIESIIYLSVLTVMILLVSNLLLNFIRIDKADNISIEMQNDARFALSKMSDEIRGANSITIPDTGANHVLIANVLRFNGNNPSGTEDVKFYVSVAGNKLYRMASGVSNLLAENIGNVIFSWQNDDRSLLKIEVEAVNGSSSYKISTLISARIKNL